MRIIKFKYRHTKKSTLGREGGKEWTKKEMGGKKRREMVK